MGELISGVKIADAIYADIQLKMRQIPRKVHLRGVIVGQNLASFAYQNIKESACKKCGFAYSRAVLPANISQDELITNLQNMCGDPNITGVIVQLPLPPHLDLNTVLSAIDELKDVDAFGYILGRKSEQMADLRPPAPKAMLKLFSATDISLAGKKVVILGHGFLVGQPLFAMLENQGILANIVDSSTKDGLKMISSADVIFSGVGQANMITPDMIKVGVIIIDAGYSRIDGVTYGDTDPLCLEKSLYMTPAIGGVGPLTVAILMQNALELANVQFGMSQK